MTRPIKFRAWHEGENQMRVNVAVGNGQVLNANHFVIPGVLIPMQFTGLTDKYGKEIYEGDILAPVNPPSPKRSNREVQFVEGSFCYDAKENRRKGGWWNLNTSKAKLFAVIGNIYENPELLKV